MNNWIRFTQSDGLNRGIITGQMPIRNLPDELNHFRKEAEEYLKISGAEHVVYATREYAEDFKKELRNYQPEVSGVLVPNCVYRCGCPEMGGGCGWYDMMVKKHPKLASTNIQERYDAYNEVFYGARRGEDGN